MDRERERERGREGENYIYVYVQKVYSIQDNMYVCKYVCMYACMYIYIYYVDMYTLIGVPVLTKYACLYNFAVPVLTR